MEFFFLLHSKLQLNVMIKAIVIGLIFTFSAMGLRAQHAELSIGAGKKLFSTVDSFREPQDTFVRMYYYVKNTGTASFSGVLTTHLKTDKGVFHINDTTVNSLNPGDSLNVSVPMYFSASAFKTGSNIIIIWPTGTGAKTVDSAKRQVTLYYLANGKLTSLFAAAGSDPSLQAYPNPLSGWLYINHPIEESVKDILVYDLTGHQVLMQTNNDRADLSTLTNGVYFARIRTYSGKEALIKLVKD